jgi:hypothetical protein
MLLVRSHVLHATVIPCRAWLASCLSCSSNIRVVGTHGAGDNDPVSGTIITRWTEDRRVASGIAHCTGRTGHAICLRRPRRLKPNRSIHTGYGVDITRWAVVIRRALAVVLSVQECHQLLERRLGTDITSGDRRVGAGTAKISSGAGTAGGRSTERRREEKMW